VAVIAGTKGPVVLPDPLVRGTAAVLGLVGRVVPLPPGYAAETVRAGMATYLGDPGKAERELGWHARDLDTGLRETVAALIG
jgi:nucleoside-diphosphate-sugar epimerase